MAVAGGVRSATRAGRLRFTGKSGTFLIDDRSSDRYILSMNVMDYAGSFWITAFNEVAEQLMGVTANQIMEWKVSISLGRERELMCVGDWCRQ